MARINPEHYDYPDLPPSIRTIATIGETALLGHGFVLQTPNPLLIDALQAIDPRVQYFPTDREEATRGAGSDLAYRYGVVDLLPARILRDFPGPMGRTTQRGTVLSVRDEFPHYTVGETYNMAKQGTDDYVTPPHVAPMLNALTVLRTGTDRGGTMGLVGNMKEDRSGKISLYPDTKKYLESHPASEFEVAEGRNAHEQADNLFPALLVYDRAAINIDAHGYLVDPSALACMYITDRILHNHRA